LAVVCDRRHHRTGLGFDQDAVALALRAAGHHRARPPTNAPQKIAPEKQKSSVSFHLLSF